MRQFYQAFPILSAVSRELTWTHYKTLVRIESPQKRELFIAESIKNAWSVRQMERQINSLLYERLLMSQDKENVLAVAKGERQPVKPHEIIKDSTVLEFLGLKPEATYVVVRYSLPADNRQIFASKYQLHLPTEAQLQAEVRKELERFSTDEPH